MSDPLTSAGEGAPANGDPVGNTTCLCNQPPKKKIPIIFSPGIMGSRLHFPAVNQDWDPDHPTTLVHWLWADAETRRTELRYTTESQIMTKQDDLSADEVTHGYAGVLEKFYVSFLRYLKAQVFNQNVDTPVWGVGYDWRRSNKVSGEALTKEVDRILGIEGAAQCILISHSMGGMVTRSAMKAGLAGKVLGVIHITQPVDGAVVMYRRYFTGAITEMDGGMNATTLVLDRIMGNNPGDYCTVSSGLPGALQLLPTNNYKDSGKPWLNYKEGGATASWSGDVYDLYTGTLNPPAVATPGLNTAVAADLKANILLAKSFHAELGRYEHGNTRTVDSTGLVTDTSVLFDPPTQPAAVTTTTKSWWGGDKTTTTTPDWKYRGLKRQAAAAGDGTVPRSSANVLPPCKEVSDIEHSDACGDKAGPIRNLVLQWVKEFVA